MKLKPGFKVAEVAGDWILVPLGDEMTRFNGTVALNEVAAFLMNQLKSERTEQELVSLLTDEYDVDPETARKDVRLAIEKMREIGVIDE